MSSIQVDVVDVNAIVGVSGCLDAGEVKVLHGADTVSTVIVVVVEEAWLLVAEVKAAVAKDDGRVWKLT